MAIYEGTRERQLSNYRAMEGMAKQAISKRVQGGDMMAPMGGPTSNILMGSGSARETRNREAYAHFRSWVYVCVDAIARRLAGLECYAGEIENAEENPERERGQIARTKNGKPVFPAHRLKTVTPAAAKYIGAQQQLNVFESHPSLDLLSRPNAVQRKFEFLYMSAANLLLTGECYWVGGPNISAEGGPEIWAVPTTWMTPVHDGGLFTSYLLKVGGQAVPKPVPADMVARTYFADPADLKTAFSPLRAIIQAIRVDDYIQESQEQMFERGINPNLIVTVGRVRGEDGTLTDRRPVLSGPNRRQIIRSIREVWNQTVSSGDPAILDGLIESVHKLHNTPQEMDWPGSGEIVKKRVMQGYKVNPIVVGEVTAGNRAQAVEAEKNFCSNAVNPLANALSETATDYVGPWFEQPTRLVVWIEEAIPTDPDQELREWSEARKNDDVTGDEYRANILGLPPLDDRDDIAPVAKTQGGLQAISTLTKQIAAREITPEQASKILQLTMRLSAQDADDICGVGLELPEPPAPPPPPTPPEPEDGEDDDADDGGDAPDEDDQGGGGSDDGGQDGDTPPEASWTPTEKARDRVKQIIAKTATQLEGGMGHSMAQHFRRSVRACTAQIEKLSGEIKPDPDNAEVQAGWIMARAFDKEAAYLDTVETAAPWIARAWARGAGDELRLLDIINKAERTTGTKTTAEDILEQYDIELPEGISIGEAPVWFQEAQRQHLAETFEQPYWTRIDETTAEDIEIMLQDGLAEGWSIRRIAREINAAHGAAYSMARGMLVARTEMTGAMNAGHQAGIEGTAAETGLPMGKEWVSVLGSTTRRSHFEADGQTTATTDGLFTVGGAEAPFPGYHGLPARERCNCQCSIISTFVMDALEQHAQAQEDPDDTPSEPSQEMLDKMRVQDVLKAHKGLEAKRKKVLDSRAKFWQEHDKRFTQLGEMRSEIMAKEAQLQDILENGLRLNADTMANQVQTDAVIGELRRQITEMDGQIAILRDKQRQAMLTQGKRYRKSYSIPTKERTRIKTDRITKNRVQENANLRNWKDDDGYRRSTGEWTKQQNDGAKEARDFYTQTLRLREDQPGIERITNVPAHSAERGARAFCRADRYGGMTGTSGVNLDPNDDFGTWVHEMGHWVEYEVKGVQRRAKEFVDYRVAKAGRPNRRMQEVIGGRYTADEIGNEDDFLKAFDREWTQGKSYPAGMTRNTEEGIKNLHALNSAMYAGKTYADGATEIISMGCQLLYDDAAGFAERDPEFFKFIVGILDGTIR